MAARQEQSGSTSFPAWACSSPSSACLKFPAWHRRRVVRTIQRNKIAIIITNIVPRPIPLGLGDRTSSNPRAGLLRSRLAHRPGLANRHVCLRLCFCAANTSSHRRLRPQLHSAMIAWGSNHHSFRGNGRRSKRLRHAALDAHSGHCYHNPHRWIHCGAWLAVGTGSDCWCAGNICAFPRPEWLGQPWGCHAGRHHRTRCNVHWRRLRGT